MAASAPVRSRVLVSVVLGVALTLLLACGVLVAGARAVGSVYVVNSGDNSVSQYDIASMGVLSPKAPASVAAGTAAEGVAVSQDGKSVYVANAGDDSVGQYDVDPLTGALSPKLPPTVSAGASLHGLR